MLQNDRGKLTRTVKQFKEQFEDGDLYRITYKGRQEGNRQWKIGVRRSNEHWNPEEKGEGNTS
jgi:hypothetical protein